jgi:hypothetical protein
MIHCNLLFIHFSPAVHDRQEEPAGEQGSGLRQRGGDPGRENLTIFHSGTL